LQPSPEVIVLLLAALVGGGAGLGVILFRLLIEVIHHVLLEGLGASASFWPIMPLVLMPIVGGAMVGAIHWWLQDLGPGLSGLMVMVQSAQEIGPWRPVAKAVAAVLSLGSGASLGPEGPSVEIGANVGVLLGQVLQVSQERQQLLLGAGAAAGLAAGFNAPIAGVFFALEVILGTSFATSAVSVVLLAAVLSALVTQIGLGGSPAFSLPMYEVRSPLELPLYLGLGLCASGVALAYTRLNQWMTQAFRGEFASLGWLGQVPRPLQPLLGGSILGLVALGLPQVLGIGYETIEAMLRDVDFPLTLLLALLGAKLLLTAISLGSGLVGGLFAPAMFLGASLGAAYGKILPLLLPWFASSIAAPPAYAMVGMAAVLAASARAPLTAILLLFELTRDYRIVLPLMAAVGFSVWLMERFKARQDIPLLTTTIEPDAEADRMKTVLQQLSVAEVMRSQEVILPATLPLTNAGLIMTQEQAHSALIVASDGQLLGILTLQDVNRALARWQQQDALFQREDSWRSQTVGEVCTRDMLSAYPEEALVDALDRMAARGIHQLPVLDRSQPHQIVGVLNREDIEPACRLALTRQTLSLYLPATPVPSTNRPKMVGEIGLPAAQHHSPAGDVEEGIADCSPR
jgi:H+/Cl- antiporter ClcA